MLRLKIILLTAVLLLCLRAPGQGRLVSVLGYVTLVPDNIGYGATDSLPIAYQMSGNSALVSAHLRKAAQEYTTGTKKERTTKPQCAPSLTWR